METRQFKMKRLIPIFLGTFLIAGCAVPLRPLSKDGLLKQSKDEIAQTQAAVEPISSNLTLEEAIARGLKYNLDFRVKQYEQALAISQNDLAALEMLPKLVGTAGYYRRNNDAINTSVNAQTGAPSTSTYISTDREIRTADLGLSWNILDFGASYFNARQQGDRVLIAIERRRKAMHNLVQDIRTAYLRAYVAQNFDSIVNATISEGEQVLKSAKQAEREKLKSPSDILKTQKIILDNLRTLEAIRQELSTANIELASYIRANPGSTITLAQSDSTLMLPKQISLPVDDMENIAIKNNADVREQIYNARIAKDDVKKNMLKLFPGISFNVGPHYSSNSFLVNNKWNDAAVQVSWNLMNVLSIPGQIASAKSANQLYEEKKVAVLMGLITQVHVSRQLYDNSYQALQRSQEILDVDRRLSEISQLKVDNKIESGLEHVTYRTAFILSMLRKYQALSQLYLAEGKLRSTLGQEIVTGDVSKVTLPQLTQEVSITLKNWGTEDLTH